MKEIRLTRGQVTKVDDEDYDFLMQWKWHAMKGRRETFYARANLSRKDGGGVLLMHRLLTKAKKGDEVDHEDHDGLNNQKYNLRLCTYSQNQYNKMSCSRSGYLGVYYNRKYIRAMIKYGDKSTHLGYFETEEAAARAYDEAAKIYHGEFANLNFK